MRRMFPKRVMWLVWLIWSGVLVWGKDPCTEQQIRSPQAPEMIEVDLDLVREGEERAALAEWSKIEKLRNFYKRHAVDQASCVIVAIQGEETALRLFIARTSLEEEDPDQRAGSFTAEKAFQFYWASRVRVERADKEATREYAFPIEGPAQISQVAETEQLDLMLEDLAQLQLVRVPRFQYHRVAGVPEDEEESECFLVSHVTAVPSRVFDRESGETNMSLNARRRALEHAVREARWLERVDTEEPACRVSESQGYLGRQIRSLNLTVRELVPEIDFVTQATQFWQEVEARIEQLRNEDEGWKKVITQGEQASQ